MARNKSQRRAQLQKRRWSMWLMPALLSIAQVANAEPSQQLYVYPAHGQTYEQQQQDQFQCYQFGKTETGFDPMAATPQRPAA